MKFRVNKFRLFWKIRNFFAKSLKKSDFKFENWEIFGFFFQIPPTTETFFFEKKVSQILLKIRSDKVQRK